MFCNIAHNRVSPEDLEKLKSWAREHRYLRSKWARENGIPLIHHMPLSGKPEPYPNRQCPPITWYYLTRPNGEFVEMTFWESEDQMRSWQLHPMDQELPKKIAPLTLDPWHDDRYHVLDV